MEGFLEFVRGVMGVGPLLLPDDAPVLGYALQVAVSIVNPALHRLAVPRIRGGPPPTSVYTLAVYNLAASNVVNFAPDQPGRDYFHKRREELGVAPFQPGVVSSTGDSGTSIALLNPEFMQRLTVANLQQLKDPYGRQYIALAQAYGPEIAGLT